MTDRIHSLTVVLDEPIRTDDVDHIVAAVSMIKHVAHVEKNVAHIDHYAAYARAHADISKKIFEALHGALGDDTVRDHIKELMKKAFSS